MYVVRSMDHSRVQLNYQKHVLICYTWQIQTLRLTFNFPLVACSVMCMLSQYRHKSKCTRSCNHACTRKRVRTRRRCIVIFTNGTRKSNESSHFNSLTIIQRWMFSTIEFRWMKKLKEIISPISKFLRLNI